MQGSSALFCLSCLTHNDTLLLSLFSAPFLPLLTTYLRLTNTRSAHTPDNSFMGFVSEELNETEKRSIQQNKVNNMAVVYGKEASMWKVQMKDVSIFLSSSSSFLLLFMCDFIRAAQHRD